jgi:hypothetical protein
VSLVLKYLEVDPQLTAVLVRVLLVLVIVV